MRTPCVCVCPWPGIPRARRINQSRFCFFRVHRQHHRISLATARIRSRNISAGRTTRKSAGRRYTCSRIPFLPKNIPSDLVCTRVRVPCWVSHRRQPLGIDMDSGGAYVYFIKSRHFELLFLLPRNRLVPRTTCTAISRSLYMLLPALFVQALDCPSCVCGRIRIVPGAVGGRG